MIFGYARVSRKEQNITRQIRNILAYDSSAKIYEEAFTGTKVEGRKEFEKLLKTIKDGDIVIFDSVSRMSRNADDGKTLYFDLMNRGIHLIFLKEPYINTEVYQKAVSRKIDITGNKIADLYIEATNEAIRILAEEQIEIAFNQAEKEVKDLQQRTKEGLETAKREGKQIGQAKGTKLVTKKSIEMKEKIQKLLPTHSDKEIIELTGLARNTYYKYKKEMIV